MVDMLQRLHAMNIKEVGTTYAAYVGYYFLSEYKAVTCDAKKQNDYDGITQRQLDGNQL